MKKILVIIIIIIILKLISILLEEREFGTLYKNENRSQKRHTLSEIESMNWN